VIKTFDPGLNGKFTQTVDSLASQGLRVLAIASQTDELFQMAGLVAFQDPPRPDSASLISRLKSLGVRVVMITGDGLLTAQAIAEKINIPFP